MSNSMIPARRVIENAIATNDQLGHENLGHLSYSHGFLPRQQPMNHFPAVYEAWDQIAEAIPEMYRNFTSRKRIHQLPLLHADDALSDKFLLRASSLLGILAHVYWYCEPNPPTEYVPDSILIPWKEVSDRLGKPAPHVSFIDLNSYNWQFRDPHHETPFMMENLGMNIPMIGNEDERRFQMTPVELLYNFSPMMEVSLKAQEAVVQDDSETLKEQLLLITELTRFLTTVTFMKVNPNPYSGPHYVNPVVWGKTAALFASPFQEEYVPGPSGTYIPSFNTMDILFGRKKYKSTVGHEMDRTRQWYPRFWREWLDALEQISIPDYVKNKGDKTLQSLFDEAHQAYAGEDSLLGRHRLKAYGYLDLSFKAGRVKTLGGIEGDYSARVWDQLAIELDEARLERFHTYPQSSYAVPVKRVETVRQHPTNPITKIVFDVSGTGLRYEAGARCAILPENSDKLVEKTITALQASGRQMIKLNRQWQTHLKLRPGYEGKTELSLRTLLKFGRLRPVDRDTAVALHNITQNEALRGVINHWAEDQWELWDLLILLGEHGYNSKKLWRAIVGDFEHICRIIKPERWRLYSISSAMEEDGLGGASEIHLTVGGLTYQTANTAHSNKETRQGTGSNFLARLANGKTNQLVSIRVVHPPRFRLPVDHRRPIVMFAGGTGIAPMRSLIEERMKRPDAGPMHLFFGTRTRDDFYYQSEFEKWETSGKLKVHVAFSREDVCAVFDAETGRYQFTPSARCHIDQEVVKRENSETLWHLLQNQSAGGAGAMFFLCGRTAFANTVLDSVKAVISQYIEGETAVKKEHNAQQSLFRLVGEDRFILEIFTTYTGPHYDETKTRYNVSEIALKNNDEAGYWMIISGRVYDVTEFGHLHPGGMKIIQSYSGMDATYAYQAIEHHTNSEVDAMLGMIELGVIRPLNFGQVWGVALFKEGVKTITLREAYQAWVKLIYTIVEMENAILNDYRIRQGPFTDIETHQSVHFTPIKVVQLVKAHQQVVENYLPQFLGAPLQTVWAGTVGLVGETKLSATWMKEDIERVLGETAVVHANQLGEAIIENLRADEQRFELDTSYLEKEYGQICTHLETADRQLLANIKRQLCNGLELFEKHEEATIQNAGQSLIKFLSNMPKIIEAYYNSLKF